MPRFLPSPRRRGLAWAALAAASLAGCTDMSEFNAGSGYYSTAYAQPVAPYSTLFAEPDWDRHRFGPGFGPEGWHREFREHEVRRRQDEVHQRQEHEPRDTNHDAAHHDPGRHDSARHESDRRCDDHGRPGGCRS